MGTNENKELIARIWDQMSEGNAKPFMDALADDVTFTVIGGTAISGTFVGKADMLDKVMKPLGSHLAGPMKVSQDNFIAEGEYVVMQTHGSAPTKSGGRYENTYCQVFRIVDGIITEWTEYLDTEAATRALAD